MTTKQVRAELAKWPKVQLAFKDSDVAFLVREGVFELVLTEKGHKVCVDYAKSKGMKVRVGKKVKKARETR